MSAPGDRIIRQASCVAINGRAILIEGQPGSGKSSLALMLIDRGAMLIGDDGVTLETRRSGTSEQLWASPPPNIGGKIEIRNVGIADLPTVSAPVALVLRLDDNAPRYVEQASQTEIAGHAVPLITLWPGSPALHLRAEWALQIHGLAIKG